MICVATACEQSIVIFAGAVHASSREIQHPYFARSRTLNKAGNSWMSPDPQFNKKS